jgi:hypothetical protein
MDSASDILTHMDEPDWDDEPLGEPDWVYDGPGEANIDGGTVDVDRPGIGAIREVHRKAYDRWTPQLDARLVAAYLAGRSVDELAADFERQPSAIQRRLERLAFAAMTRHREKLNGAEPS